MRIVLLSHTGRTGSFRVGSHHLARQLAALGHKVGHVSNPIALAHVARTRDPEIRRRATAAARVRGRSIDGVTYLVPWGLYPLAPSPFLRRCTLGSTTALVAALRSSDLLPIDLLLVDQPLFLHLLDHLPHREMVYRPTDLLADPGVRRVEEDVIARATGVVATSAVVADHVRAVRQDLPVTVIENGVEYSHFAAASKPWEGRSGACYVGALDGRLDWEVIKALGTARPDVTIDIFGPPPPSIPSDQPANVRVRGPVGYRTLPDVLAEHRVGLLPLNDDPTNNGRSPMKLFEYLASGMTVVARDTEAIRAHGLHDVHTYDSVSQAKAAFDSALESPPGPEAPIAAQSMDWSARTEALLAAVTGF